MFLSMETKYVESLLANFAVQYKQCEKKKLIWENTQFL